MQVEQLMTRAVQCCSPTDSLERAAQLMWDYDCGCLPVCEDDGARRVIGVITDRDVCMGALFQARPLREITVADSMAKQVIACLPEDSLEEAEGTMRAARVRRLPVVDEDSQLIGILSLADIARESTALRATSDAPTVLQLTDTLAHICAAGNRARAGTEASL